MQVYFRRIFSVSLGLTILVLLIYGFLLVHEVNLVTADIGRHIKNGEVLLNNFEIIKTNFYSYTQQDFPTVNHHWGSGALFFVIWKMFGFSGLHLFFVLISSLTLFIFWRIARSRAGPGISALTFLLVLPLLAERLEIRPEIFSYLFAGLFLWVLLRFKEEKVSYRVLLLLPLIEILWVNSHIYFILGPLLIGAFLLESFIFRELRDKFFGKLAGVFALTVVATIFNPFGFKGIVAPFTIFQNYGYRLIENQPVWFIQKLIPRPNLLVFELIFIILILSFILVLVNKKQLFRNVGSWDHFWVGVFLASGFSIMGWLAIRNFTIFGFFVIPIIAWNIGYVFKPRFEKYGKWFNSSVFVVVLITFLVIASGGARSLTRISSNFGLGLEPDNSRSAEFFETHDIQGPIFNNYDIGGYLIFHLFPKHRVFVDNRPEAYSISFFKNIYVPMQEDGSKWLEQDNEHNFNAIFFYWRDATPWGQNFLIKRVSDPQWAPVFIDRRVLILLKRNKINASVIEQFEIPQSVFGVVES